MGVFEWVAIVGAAAWAPQVIGWIAHYLAKPKLRIIPSNAPEIGYTSFGPIFNLTCSIAAERKDAVIERITVTLKHERGQHIFFLWDTLNETFSQIRSKEGLTEVGKNQPAIALKVSTLILTEKTIGMREKTFLEESRRYSNALADHINFLKKTEPDYQKLTLKSKELDDLIKFYKQRFPWQVGQYVASTELRIAGVKEPTTQEFAFALTARDLDYLKQNLDEIERYIPDLIQPQHGILFNWNWLYPTFHSNESSSKDPA